MAVVQDARAFPAPDRRSINRAVATYVREVRTREFKALADGEHDPVADARALAIVAAVQAYEPRTATQTTFYGAAADQLNVFLGERDNRVCQGRDRDPGSPARAADLPGHTTITVSLFIQTHRPSADTALVVVVSVIVGSGLLTALILQYPYSGAIAVKSDPLTEGLLSRLGDRP
jgi:hypothetical protein